MSTISSGACNQFQLLVEGSSHLFEGMHISVYVMNCTILVGGISLPVAEGVAATYTLTRMRPYPIRSIELCETVHTVA